LGLGQSEPGLPSQPAEQLLAAPPPTFLAAPQAELLRLKPPAMTAGHGSLAAQPLVAAFLLQQRLQHAGSQFGVVNFGGHGLEPGYDRGWQNQLTEIGKGRRGWRLEQRAQRSHPTADLLQAQVSETLANSIQDAALFQDQFLGPVGAASEHPQHRPAQAMGLAMGGQPTARQLGPAGLQLVTGQLATHPQLFDRFVQAGPGWPQHGSTAPASTR